MSFFEKIKRGLDKTRKNFTEKIDQILGSYSEIDDELLEDLEMALISADVGVPTTEFLLNIVKQSVKAGNVNSPKEIKPLLQAEITKLLSQGAGTVRLAGTAPTVFLVVGVNGVGKTTTIGKLSNFYQQLGLKVILAAGDTFRAAAVEQLEIWGQRSKATIVKQAEGSDPAAVTFDALKAAKSRNADLLIIDTAGRLHTKSNLMEELKKIRRVVERELENGPHETLLVLDATTGQNAINQAKVFNEAVQLTGVVLTKLDGTAKGGVVIAIKHELGIPVKWIGVGEGVDDLRPFNPEEFAQALFND